MSMTNSANNIDDHILLDNLATRINTNATFCSKNPCDPPVHKTFDPLTNTVGWSAKDISHVPRAVFFSLKIICI